MSEIPPDVRRHWRIVKELEDKNQTDRGVAIIGAAYLEERLTEVICSRLLDKDKKPRFLFHFLRRLRLRIFLAYWEKRLVEI